MNVTLTPELKALVERKVASGMYKSASEVIREALRLLEEHEKDKEVRLAALRIEIEKGLRDIENGDVELIDKHAMLAQIKAEGRASLAKLQEKV